MFQVVLVCIGLVLLVCCECSFLERRQSTLIQDFPKPEACAAMANHGTHFTVDVHIGTPSQTFSVVADTGSNHLIVPSCICQENQNCGTDSRCFQGTNRSSTFHMEEVVPGQGPPTMVLSFGSGDIEAAIVSDIAELGHLQANMNHSLLVMTDQQLNMPGPFEGILGLGMPQNHTKLIYNSSAETEGGSEEMDISDILGGELQKIIDAISHKDGSSVTDDRPDVVLEIDEHLSPISKHQPPEVSKQSKGNKEVEQPIIREIPDPISFLEQAGISRFSMCFNDGGLNGTLHIGTTPGKTSLSSIGSFHWGLGLEGINVGEKSLPVSICNRENMTNGQQSPCGAIPDSGTTAIMGPSEGLALLMDSICDGWERCRSNHTLLSEAKSDALQAVQKDLGFDPFGISKVEIAKSDILQLLLQDCGMWLTEEKGINELPSIKFQLAGKSGNQQTIELSAWAYVIESEQPVMEQVDVDIPGIGRIPLGVNATDRVEKSCALSFGDMQYKTGLNGDVWILGGPLFYEYHVGYDLLANPPSISFEATKDTPCMACGPEGVALASQTAEIKSGRHVGRRPRQIQGPMRKPSIDVTLPL